MAPAISSLASELAVYLNPALCANHHNTADGLAQCKNSAGNACGGCQLVQYCSKECQKADWKRHKAICKSELMKESWTPGWHREYRTPAFIGDGPPMVQFGAKKYLWGNMPALDILNLKDNEKDIDPKHNFALLFAASGDPRNVFKTIVGLPVQHEGKCDVVLNDWDFDIVARNAIMLLVALHYDPEVAVPMIIHIWYSALLPSGMVQSLQSDILPMIEEVCGKIKSKARDSLQSKTFTIRGRTLRLVLKKEEWMNLVAYIQVPEGLSAKEAQMLRHDIVLAPARIDYRERAMLQWPPALRVGEMYFRSSGVLLPLGCSLAAFDTPNPTLFQTHDWPMMDNASPRDGWSNVEHSKHSLVAKADAFGAVFALLRDLLLKFCERVTKFKISFDLYCVNAMEIASHVGAMRFDRIEISNICDRFYVGPQLSLKVFSPLLKDKAANPKATLLMLFLNAVKEIEFNSSDAVKMINKRSALTRVRKYLPMDTSSSLTNIDDPYFIRCMASFDLLTDWSTNFDVFSKKTQLATVAALCGVKMKSKNTIIEAWPYTVGPRATKKEFDILAAESTSGIERYVEFEKLQ
ncbi:hypothetical protein EJ07DRAFT_174795 [Lizonia empirigonia]|nr:hypothetical protein EJ07DRAFT_174795 [Lizonia empirigonia]